MNAQSDLELTLQPEQILKMWFSCPHPSAGIACDSWHSLHACGHPSVPQLWKLRISTLVACSGSPRALGLVAVWGCIQAGSSLDCFVLLHYNSRDTIVYEDHKFIPKVPEAKKSNREEPWAGVGLL